MSGTSSPAALVAFDVEDRSPVVTVMEALLRDRDGWINLQPAVDAEDAPDPSPVLSRVLSPRGPEVPLVSWVPGARKRSGRAVPVSVGLQHHGGPKAMARLAREGHRLPTGWRIAADHPRSGLVFWVPDAEPPDATLLWLMRAASLLTEMKLPKTWNAAVFRH